MTINVKTYFVYIMATTPRGPIYIGVTNDLVTRVAEHKSGIGSKHVKTYNITRLVYFETHDNIDDAITREKRLKRWRRDWKDKLIEDQNPNWEDLTIKNLEY